MDKVNSFNSEAYGKNVAYLYEHSPIGHILFKPDGTILHANHTLLQWLEAPGDALPVGTKISSLLSKAGQMYYQVILQPSLGLQKNIQEINLDIITLAGKRFSCLFNAKEIHQDTGSGYLLLGTLSKIDDRKKYEEQLLKERQNADEGRRKMRFLANSIPVLIYTRLPDGEVNFVNDRFCEYLNVKRNEFDVKTFAQYVHPDDYPAIKTMWIESVKHEEGFESEFRMLNQSREYEWFIARTVPYKNEEGKLVLWFGSLTNINAQKQKQIKLVAHLEDNLQQSNGIISKNEMNFKQIAFEQSHLVRHPLANILGIVHLLESMTQESELQPFIAMLKESAESLDGIIAGIVNKTDDPVNPHHAEPVE